jgi:DNA primase large subunit
VRDLLFEEEIRWAAKYPFDKHSRDIIRNISLDIDEYNEDDLRFLLDNAFDRVLNALSNEYELLWDNDYQETIEFYLSLLIVRGTDNEFIYRVFSDVEAKRAYDLLRDDEIQNIIKVSNNLEIATEIDKRGKFKVYFMDFIRLIRGLSGIHWKLYNFEVDRGFVVLQKREVVRLCTQKIREVIYNMIKNIDVIPDFILEYSNRLKEIKPEAFQIRYRKIKIENVSAQEYPPCITEIINNIGRGIPHTARFTLVTFLHKIGYKVDDIVLLFSRVPDFNEEKTRYQVEHILGLRGGRKEYMVPSCKKIRSYGFCFPDDHCRFITNPLKYLIIKRRIKNEEKRSN